LWRGDAGDGAPAVVDVAAFRAPASAPRPREPVMRFRPIAAMAAFLVAGGAGRDAAAGKDDEPKLFPLPHMHTVKDDVGAGADRAPDIRSFTARAAAAGMEVELVLHEDVPAWEHLLQVAVAAKDAKEEDRVVRVRSATEWVVKAKEEKGTEGGKEPAADPDEKKDKYPREVATGASTRDGVRYSFVVPWAALPDGDLWVWASAYQWDPDGPWPGAAAEDQGTKKKKKKKSEKLPDPVNLADRAPDGDRVIEVVRASGSQAAR